MLYGRGGAWQCHVGGSLVLGQVCLHRTDNAGENRKYRTLEARIKHPQKGNMQAVELLRSRLRGVGNRALVKD